MEYEMSVYDKTVLNTFLEKQLQLFPEKVADTPEEAEMFLEDCMAVVCRNIYEVREYFDSQGMDVAGMDDGELEEAQEVFLLPDNRYLIVEG